MMTIGDRVRRLRESQHLTVIELSRRAGIAYSYLSRLENNKRLRIRSDTAERLANALNVNVEQIIMDVQKEIKKPAQNPYQAMTDLQKTLPLLVPVYKDLEKEDSIVDYIFLANKPEYQSAKAVILLQGILPFARRGDVLILDVMSKPEEYDTVLIKTNSHYQIIVLTKETAERLNPTVFKGILLFGIRSFKHESSQDDE